MDPFSLAIGAAMLFGLLSADAVISANTVVVSVTVPPAIVQTGLTQDVAERLLVSEITRMSQGRSLLRAPSMQSARDPTIVGVVANALKLDGFTGALQDLFGLDRPRVTASIVTPAANLQRLLVTYRSERAGTFMLTLDGEAGPEALVRAGAAAIMDQVEPYRSALFYFEQALAAGSSDFSRVKALAERLVDNTTRRGEALEHSYLLNLLGIVALLENDLSKAESHFRRSFATNQEFHVGRLNFAFTLIQRDLYQQALEVLTPLLPSHRWRLFANRERGFAPLIATTYDTAGVARWHLGDLDGAEASFRAATQAFPQSEAAYTYWSRLLRERGRTAEAAEKMEFARTNSTTFENYPEVASLFFWMSPMNNQPLQRRSREIVSTGR